MLSLLKYILIYTASIILILHTMVAHEHQGEVTVQVGEETCLESSVCLRHWLEHVFDEDLGEGHLEYFVQSNLSLGQDYAYHPSLDNNFLLGCALQRSEAINDGASRAPNPSTPPLTSHVGRSHALRAPPAVG